MGKLLEGFYYNACRVHVWYIIFTLYFPNSPWKSTTCRQIIPYTDHRRMGVEDYHSDSQIDEDRRQNFFQMGCNSKCPLEKFATPLFVLILKLSIGMIWDANKLGEGFLFEIQWLEGRELGRDIRVLPRTSIMIFVYICPAIIFIRIDIWKGESNLPGTNGLHLKLGRAPK